MKLPTPHQLDSLVQLAAHDRPEVRAQALELCRMLPVPVRMLAAARLAEQHAFHAAALCAWPDDEVRRADLLRAVIRDCGEHIHARWLEETEGDACFESALAPEGSGRSLRSIRTRLEKAVSAHPSRAVYAMAIIGMAQLEEDPAAGIAACHDHLPKTSTRPDGARPWMATRMCRHLARQRPLTRDDRYHLAAAFAAALNDDEFDRAGLLLTGGCAYAVRGDILHGPEAILSSYRDSIVQGAAYHTRFDAVAYASSVSAVEEHTVLIAYADHLMLNDQQHTFRCQQRLWMDALGRIWRIEHTDLPGEQKAMIEFERIASSES
ncbi:MAG: hypothetical protein ACI8RZ_007567 [Myxococcota bacterium]